MEAKGVMLQICYMIKHPIFIAEFKESLKGRINDLGL